MMLIREQMEFMRRLSDEYMKEANRGEDGAHEAREKSMKCWDVYCSLQVLESMRRVINQTVLNENVSRETMKGE